MGVNVGISIPRETHKEGKRFLVVGGGGEGPRSAGGTPQCTTEGPFEKCICYIMVSKMYYF